MKRKLTVVLERAEGNWCAYTPDDVGIVIATGQTREETIANFRSALAAQFALMREEGLPVPEIKELEIRETVALAA